MLTRVGRAAAALLLALACAMGALAQTSSNYQYPALAYVTEGNYLTNMPSPAVACATFASHWGWDRNGYSTQTLTLLPGLWKCQRYYNGTLDVSNWTRVRGQCQTAAVPLSWLTGRYVTYPMWSEAVGMCYCNEGSAFNSDIQWCERGDSSDTIALSGASSTKALAAGPVLPHTAKVTQGNGSPAANKAVSVTVAGRGTINGTTDAAGEFRFTYVPPYQKPTVDQLSATCNGCANTAHKTITVQACDICEKGFGNPIQPATGQKEQHETDWSDAGAHPLTFTRHYRSLGNLDASFDAGLGAGWSHNWKASVTQTALEATVRLGEGSGRQFRRASAQSPWTAVSGRDSLLEGQAGISYLRASDESRWSFDSGGKLLSITERNGWTATLAYNGSQLTSVTNAFGRSVQFGHDSTGHLASVTFPDEQTTSYGYDTNARLARVTTPDGAARRYHYEDARWPQALTGITDEAGIRYATYAYDADGRAIATSHAGAAQSYGISYSTPVAAAALVPGWTIDPALYLMSAQVNDPLGTVQRYTWQGGDGQLRLISANGAFEGAQVASRSIGPLGLPETESDFLGVQTSYGWDASRQLKLTTTQAAGRPEAQTRATQWHPTFRLPVLVTEPGRTTASTYDASGNKLSETITDTATGQARTTAWTYNAQGLADKQTDPKGGVWSYSYDSAGNRTSSKDPLGQSTRYGYDGGGRVTTQTDPNGLVTSWVYDARGRLIVQNRGGEASTFSYWPTGQLASATLPNGYQVSYSYDAAQRLVAAQDNRGNRVAYTLDAMGNRIAEEVKDANGNVALATGRVINSLNQLASIQGAQGQSTALGYDANGEAVAQTDPLNQTTRQMLDGLRRPVTTTFADHSTATQAWNALGQLSQVTDPKGVATRYQTNAFGDVMSETSADIGSLTYQRDANGHVVAVQDAKGATHTISRDALGRATQITYADQTQRFDYDAAGNVSRIEDNSGRTVYSRDAQGRVLGKVQTSVNDSSTPLKISYSYQGGELAGIGYPSGLQVFYRRAAGRITGIDVQPPPNASGKVQPVTPFVSNLAHTALGAPKSWSWSNGDSASRSFDADGRMSQSEIAGYGYDAASRITAITQTLWASKTVTQVIGTGTFTITQLYQTPVTWSAGYDSRNRLTSFARSGASTTYSYDANSNRLSAVDTASSEVDLEGAFDAAKLTQSNSQSLNLDAASNQLLGFSQTLTTRVNGVAAGSVTSRVSYALDANGAMTSDGLRSFDYDVSRRLAQVRIVQDGDTAKVSYLHNALGQRVFKSVPQLDWAAPSEEVWSPSFINWLKQNFGWLFKPPQSTTSGVGTDYVYAEDGSLLGEYDNTGGKGRSEYLWLPVEGGQAMPIGLYRNGKFYAVHADHLGTPRLVTDSANTPVWQWPYSAFGNNKPSGALQATTTAGGQVALKGTKPPVEVNLRFPGQYFDSESNLAYNYFRSYQPTQGRYTQPDLIGLSGGFNRYLYVNGMPMLATDMMGLRGKPAAHTPTSSPGPMLNFPLSGPLANPNFYDPDAGLPTIDDPCVQKYLIDTYGSLLGFVVSIGNVQQFSDQANPDVVGSYTSAAEAAAGKGGMIKLPGAISKTPLAQAWTGMGSMTAEPLAAFTTVFGSLAMKIAREHCRCPK